MARRLPSVPHPRQGLPVLAAAYARTDGGGGAASGGTPAGSSRAWS